MTQAAPPSRVFVLMFTDLVDSTRLKVELGDTAYAEHVARPHNEIFRRILRQFPEAAENNYTGDGFLATFERVSDAVNAALLFHHALRTFPWQRVEPRTRIAIHLGESVMLEGASPNETIIASHAADVCARVMGLGQGGQTLLTRAAFDNARQYVRVVAEDQKCPSMSSARSQDEIVKIGEVFAIMGDDDQARFDGQFHVLGVRGPGKSRIGWNGDLMSGSPSASRIRRNSAAKPDLLASFGAGDADCVIVAQRRNMPLLTNDRRVRNFCRE